MGWFGDANMIEHVKKMVRKKNDVRHFSLKIVCLRYFEYMGLFWDAKIIENVKEMIRKKNENFDFRHFLSKFMIFHLKSSEII